MAEAGPSVLLWAEATVVQEAKFAFSPVKLLRAKLPAACFFCALVLARTNQVAKAETLTSWVE
jgi:hypothetical protein